MRAWKAWSAEWSMRVKSEVREIRQLVKKHKKLYSKYRPHKGFRRKYRNRNARRRMMKKTWDLIVKTFRGCRANPYWEMDRWGRENTDVSGKVRYENVRH